ncbi:MAG: glycosyltransferase family 39 protein [Candidatus Dormibacteraeota bacterium]|nr:glycosyltransferase family 39 protein [Candidatus Dormibacteraeota bacterium]MBV9525861.1 glycosyltransferase family 39 protein [Candidatus Dormibacteraeota bacterium]
MFAYLVAVAFRLFGASTYVLRGTAAAVGVLGVVAVWLAVRRFGRVPALIAMAWTAGSLWMICVSRDGFRNITTVALGGLALAAALCWAHRPIRWWALAAGAAAGAGLWTFQPLKLAPLLLIVWLLWLRHADRARYLEMRHTALFALLGYLLVGGPMLWTAITDAIHYFARAASVAAFNPIAQSPDSFPAHVLKTLGMFLVTGDPNQRHDVDALPLLGPLLFIPFALGVWRAWRRRSDASHALLIAGLVVYLLPPVLAVEGGAPHFLRSLGLVPFVAALVAIGCLEAAQLVAAAARRWWPAVSPVASPVAVGIGAGAVLLVGLASIRTYLERPVAERYDAYSFALVALARAADHGPGTAVVVDSYSAFDVQFLDAPDPPTIVDPGQRITSPKLYSLLVAPSRDAIASATDQATAARAAVVAVDIRGQPVAWQVQP